MMRLVFMGTPDWAIPSLEGLQESGHKLTGVLTQPDRYAGRNRVLAVSPVKQEALKRGLQVFTPEKGDNPETFEVLKELNPDLILVCAYGQILPQDLIDLPRRGCFNLHFSHMIIILGITLMSFLRIFKFTSAILGMVNEFMRN